MGSSIQRSIIQWYKNLTTAINRIEDLRIEEYTQAPTHLLPLRMGLLLPIIEGVMVTLLQEVLTDNQEELLYITQVTRATHWILTLTMTTIRIGGIIMADGFIIGITVIATVITTIGMKVMADGNLYGVLLVWD